MMTSEENKTVGSAGGSVKLFCFDDSKDEWNVWSRKTCLLCSRFECDKALDDSLADVMKGTKEEVKEGSKKKNCQAFEHLALSAKGTVFWIVMNSTSPKFPKGDACVAWRKLCKKHEPGEKDDLTALEQDWIKTALKEKRCKDIDEWFNELDRIQNRLIAIGDEHKKMDFHVKVHVFNGLDDETFETFKIAHQANCSNCKIDDLKNKIGKFWETKNEASNIKLPAGVFHAKQFKGKCRNCNKHGHPDKKSGGQGNDDRSGNGNRKDLKCHDCEKMGHVKKNCWAPGGGAEKKQSNVNASSHFEDTFVGSISHAKFCGMCNDDVSDNDNILVDSDTTHSSMPDLICHDSSDNENEDHDEDNKDDNKNIAFVNDDETQPKKLTSVGAPQPATTWSAIHRDGSKAEHKEECDHLSSGIAVNGFEKTLMDTGASCHVACKSKGMMNMHPSPVTVTVGAGNVQSAECEGKPRAKTADNKDFAFERMQFVPNFKKLICSMPMLLDNWILVNFKKRHLEVINKNGDVVKCNREKDGMFCMEIKRLAAEQVNQVDIVKKMEINAAHDKFGHSNEQMLKKTAAAAGRKLHGDLLPCEDCLLAKAEAKSAPKSAKVKATNKGERFCIDVSGPCKKSPVGTECWVSVVNEFTRKAWSCFLKKKKDLGSVVCVLVESMKHQGIFVKHIRCDNAGENQKGLQDKLFPFGCEFEFNAPNAPQQNGVIERKFAVIMNGAIVEMIAADLTCQMQGSLWVEAIRLAALKTNMACNTVNTEAPDAVWHGSLDVHACKCLMPFGLIGAVAIRQKQPELEAKAEKMIHLSGFSEQHPCDTFQMFDSLT